MSLHFISVTLKSKTGGQEFEGFMLRVHRTQGDTEECLGTFSGLPIKTQGLSYHNKQPGAVVGTKCSLGANYSPQNEKKENFLATKGALLSRHRCGSLTFFAIYKTTGYQF